MRTPPTAIAYENAEFVVAHVGARRTQHEREVVGDPQRLPAIHAHANQHLRCRHRPNGPSEVVVLEKQPDRRIPILGQYVVEVIDGYDVAAVPHEDVDES